MTGAPIRPTTSSGFITPDIDGTVSMSNPSRPPLPQMEANNHTPQPAHTTSMHRDLIDGSTESKLVDPVSGSIRPQDKASTSSRSGSNTTRPTLTIPQGSSSNGGSVTANTTSSENATRKGKQKRWLSCPSKCLRASSTSQASTSTPKDPSVKQPMSASSSPISEMQPSSSPSGPMIMDTARAHWNALRSATRAKFGRRMSEKTPASTYFDDYRASVKERQASSSSATGGSGGGGASTTSSDNMASSSKHVLPPNASGTSSSPSSSSTTSSHPQPSTGIVPIYGTGSDPFSSPSIDRKDDSSTSPTPLPSTSMTRETKNGLGPMDANHTTFGTTIIDTQTAAANSSGRFTVDPTILENMESSIKLKEEQERWRKELLQQLSRLLTW